MPVNVAVYLSFRPTGALAITHIFQYSYPFKKEPLTNIRIRSKRKASNNAKGETRCIVLCNSFWSLFLPWPRSVCPPAPLADENASASIEQTFQKAKQEYLDKNMTAAAEQIQKGAA
jgi:hypothetical protein